MTLTECLQELDHNHAIIIKTITTEDLIKELNHRKEIEVDKQIEVIRSAVNTLKMLGVKVVEGDGRWYLTDVDYEDEMVILNFSDEHGR